MKIFLAGATTEIGARAARILAEHGHEIRALYRTALHLDRIPEHELIEPVFGDLNEPAESLPALVANADAIISTVHLRHTARLATALVEWGDEQRWRRTPLIAISSARIHSKYDGDGSVAELKDAEQRIEALHLPTLIIRPTMIYGTRGVGVIDTYNRWIARGLPIPLVGGGHSLIQPVWAGDVARAIILALFYVPDSLSGNGASGSQNQNSEIPTTRVPEFRALDIGGGEPLSIREALRILAAEQNRTARTLPLSKPLLLLAARLLFFKRGLRESILRQTEDRTVEIQPLKSVLDIHPVCFDEGRELWRAELSAAK